MSDTRKNKLDLDADGVVSFLTAALEHSLKAMGACFDRYGCCRCLRPAKHGNRHFCPEHIHEWGYIGA